MHQGDKRTYLRLIVAGGLAVPLLIFPTVVSAARSDSAVELSRVATAQRTSPVATKVSKKTPWKLRFQDDFNGTALGSKWGTYAGTPGGNPTTTWRGSQVWVGGGALHIRAAKKGSHVISGGLANYRVHQRYGKWELRMKMSSKDLVKFVFLLWPTHGWPPEIDFAEDHSGQRGVFGAHMHYGVSNRQISRHSPSINTMSWHRIAVQWRPNKLQYLIDGHVWSTVRSNHVPKERMWLAIQTEGLRRSLAHAPASVDLEVDRVQVWSWKGA